MNFYIDNIKKLMEENAKNNYHIFAKMLNVDSSQLHRLINGKGGSGAKIILALLSYCKKNNLNIYDYIFLN